MRQVTQNYKTGKISLEDVEAPLLRPGGILVRTRYSAISIGTEGMKVKEAKLSYLGKARARPDQVTKVLDTIRQQGIVAAYQKVMNKLDSLTPLGYSLSGEVIAVGSGAEEFHIGQRVACAGAGYANHAEINYIPKNLVVPIPDPVSLKHAAFSTIGAIALQGFRQAQTQLGETACVIGLGLLGQLLVQILRAAGVQVVGVDIVERRCRLAEAHGAMAAVTPSDSTLDGVIARFTGGHGVDRVFITAGGSSNAAAELAIRIARDRACIVDVGKTRLDLPWNESYLKELEVRFSRSYGPGRYDPTYEEKGIDYPIGYVRWREKRNLGAFLELVKEGKVQIDPVISSVKPFNEAESVFQAIAESGTDVLGVLFEYGEVERENARTLPVHHTESKGREPGNRRLRVAAIGAGNYASSMLFPHLARTKQVQLVAVATASSLSAENARRKFGFEIATTNYKELLERDDIDAVVVTTRHASHARIVSDALRMGKATYVEKPLAISLDDVELVRGAIAESGNDRLLVGFNRRFSPMIGEIGKRYRGLGLPLVTHYRVHAGRLAPESWYLDPNEGSRFIGEAGHFFDVLAYVVDSRPTSVVATALRPLAITADDLENIAAVVRYENGSIGNLLYLTQGGSRVPKEYLEVFGGGTTVQMNNFESLSLFDNRRHKRGRPMRTDKGQNNELQAFVEAARTGAPMPISVDSLFDTTFTTLAGEESLRTGAVVELDGYWGKNK